MRDARLGSRRRGFRAASWLAVVAIVAAACFADEVGHTDEELRGVDTTAVSAPRGGPPPGHVDEPLPTTLTCENQVMQMAMIASDATGAATAEEAVSLEADPYGKHHPLPPEGWETWDEYGEATGASDPERYIVTAHETDEPVAILVVWDAGDRGFFITESTMCGDLYENLHGDQEVVAHQSSTIETQRGPVTLACAETDVEMYMFAPAKGNGAPDPIAAAEATLAGAPVSVDTSGLAFVEREFGIVAWFDEDDANVLEPDLITIAWVEPIQLRDGTWGAGSASFCGSEFA